MNKFQKILSLINYKISEMNNLNLFTQKIVRFKIKTSTKSSQQIIDVIAYIIKGDCFILHLQELMKS